MKMTLHAALIAGLLSCSTAFAQTGGVPSEMSYQATVTDDVGNLLAPTSAVSYEVIMRIYDAATGGNLLWSEQQVTDIFQGKFSIIMGQGIPVPIVGGNEPRPDLATVFGGSERFTELTVRENSPGKLPKTLAPRQKLVATATALRARLAEGLVNGAVISDGAIPGSKLTNGTLTGSKLANSTITSTQIQNSAIATAKIADSAITTAKIADSAIKTPKIDNSAITTAKIADSAITNSKLASAIDPIKLNPGTVDRFEFGYLNGVTSAIQTQLNNKANLNSPKFTGNVGIGTNSPSADLHVYSTSDPTIKIQSNGNSQLSGRLSLRQKNDTGVDLYYDGSQDVDHTAFECFVAGVSQGKAMVIKDISDRKLIIGMGTETPSNARLHIVGGVIRDAPGLTGDRSFSMWASDSIASDAAFTFSDVRIKEVIGKSDSTEDLETLKKIVITDYLHKDESAHGKTLSKKVVAQQVEDVFPQIVTQTTNTIPDIQKRSKVIDGWIYLETDLKVGERVALTYGDSNKSVYEVTKVEADRFKTSFHPPSDLAEIFVYGREVNDFRMVDYDGIAMLNVSATQELARRLEAKEKEVDELKARLDAMAARMISIENALSGDQLTVNSLSK